MLLYIHRLKFSWCGMPKIKILTANIRLGPKFKFEYWHCKWNLLSRKKNEEWQVKIPLVSLSFRYNYVNLCILSSCHLHLRLARKKNRGRISTAVSISVDFLWYVSWSQISQLLNEWMNAYIHININTYNITFLTCLKFDCNSILNSVVSLI